MPKRELKANFEGLLHALCNALLLLTSAILMGLSAGTNIGGGTFWGLCKLLTGMDNFDDILSLSSQGDNSNVRMQGLASFHI